MPPLKPFLLALSLGAAGGAFANSFDLPLAWMIGAMAATTTAALLGARLVLPQPLRNVMVALLGIMLGSGFSPAILQQLGDWAVSLTALLAYTALAGGLSMLYFRRLAGYEPTTAFFAAMPGGLSEMYLVGSAMGGDGRVISLIHASRIMLVVFSLPFAFQLLLNYQPAGRPPVGPGQTELALLDLAILAGCGLFGFLGARLLKLPAAAVLGPMVLSGVVHLAGITEAKPPALLIALAQVVIGTSIGCRFTGTPVAMIGRTAFHAAVGTVLLLAVTLVFAFGLAWLTGLSMPALVLAFAPGGLAEMSLIALALGLDAAFVATHHAVRICVIVILAPAVFRRRKRLLDRDPA